MTEQENKELARELAQLTDATHRLCRLHGTLGLIYPRTSAFTALVGRPARHTENSPGAPLPPSAPPPAQPSPTMKKEAAPAGDHEIAALKDTIQRCELCLPETARPAPLFGNGRVKRPSLLIVGDAATETGITAGAPFAGETGELLGKMLAAINLGMDEVFVTNIIRCSLPPDQVPLATQLANCQHHLRHQVKLFRPHIICTMGQLASQALLGTKNKLIALRGRFHQFENIPLMATYHPTQLIQVPDLKKAAWYDLQLIQHRLRQLKIS